MTILVPLTNAGTSESTGGSLEFDGTDGVLEPTSVTLADPSGLRGPRAFAAPGAATSCASNTCELPPLPPGPSTAIITLTITTTNANDVDELTEPTVQLGNDSKVFDLPKLVPELSAPQNWKAGNTVDLTATFDTDIASPVVVGVEGQPEGFIFVGDTPCGDRAATACSSTNTETPSTAIFSVTALPNVDGAAQDLTVSLNSTLTTHVTMPAVAARAPGDPIDMTGPFAGTSVGEPTTHCLLAEVCHFHSHPYTVSGRTALWAGLTWIAPEGSSSAATTRTVKFGTDPCGDDSCEINGTARRVVARSGHGIVAVSADVTSQFNSAVSAHPASPVAVSMPSPMDPLGPDDVTGWALTVIWADPQANQNVSTTTAMDASAPSDSGPMQLEIARPGTEPSGIGALLLWNDAATGRTDWQGTFCDQTSCGPIAKTPVAEHDGSVVVDLTSPHTIAVVGPTFVQRDPAPTQDPPSSDQTSAALPRP